MADRGKMMKFRALKEFEGHKEGDIVEMPFLDARAYVNSGKLTADLGEMQVSEGKERRAKKEA